MSKADSVPASGGRGQKTVRLRQFLTGGAVRAGIMFILGVLFSRAAVFGKFNPFGLSLMGAFEGAAGGAAALVGCALGYFTIPGDLMSMRYISACMIVFGVRFFIRGFKEIRRIRMLDPLLAAGVCLSTGLAIGMQGAASVEGLLLAAAEALLCGAVTFLIKWALPGELPGGGMCLGRPGEDGRAQFSSKTLAGVITAGAVITLALSGVGVLGMSLGGIIAMFAVYYAARSGGMAAGCVAGAASGLVMLVGSPDNIYLISAYSLAGLLAGFFQKSGTPASIVGFVLSALVMTSYLMPGQAIFVTAQAIIAVSLVMLLRHKLPRELGFSAAAAHEPPDEIERSEKIRTLVKERMEVASGVLGELATAVYGDRAKPRLAENLAEAFHRAANKVCRRCGLNQYCWGRDYDAVMEGVQELAPILRSRGYVTPDDLHKHFRQRCVSVPVFADRVNAEYAQMKGAKPTAAQGGRDMDRDILREQYRNVSLMMQEISEELASSIYFDPEAEAAVKEYFQSLGVGVQSAVVLRDSLQKLEVEVRIADIERLRVSAQDIAAEIGRRCARVFAEPSISPMAGGYAIVLHESEALTVSCKKAALQKSGETVAGDAVGFGEAGDGRYYIAISDGMGSGKVAARESAFAVELLEKLIKSGFRRETAIKLINAALILKSEDESLTTLDITIIDLYSGDTEFIKVGAAPTFVIRQKKLYRIESNTMPVGILTDITPERTRCRLMAGDVILMMSDGVLGNGDDAGFIEKIIREAQQYDEALASKIVSAARQISPAGRDDDISVVLAQVDARH